MKAGRGTKLAKRTVRIGLSAWEGWVRSRTRPGDKAYGWNNLIFIIHVSKEKQKKEEYQANGVDGERATRRDRSESKEVDFYTHVCSLFVSDRHKTVTIANRLHASRPHPRTLVMNLDPYL